MGSVRQFVLGKKLNKRQIKKTFLRKRAKRAEKVELYKMQQIGYKAAAKLEPANES